ncbi:MAG: Glycogen synthase [Turneriella sp.]|nr:Glycogen synthase [Turneriella sp.]
MNIVEISSECSGLAQRGGLGSVVWGLCDAFTRTQHSVTLIMPYYKEITLQARMYSELKIFFGGEDTAVSVFETTHAGIRTFLIYSDNFFRGEYGDVYIDSGKLGRGYFEDDAKRFAFFSLAAAHLVLHLSHKEKIDAIHCHDWHTGLVLFFAKIHPLFENIRNIKRLFTIHNLEYQGTRPYRAMQNLRGFLDWFPNFSTLGINSLVPYLDPHTDVPCINPLRAAIHSASVVTTVSPSYAEEICRADVPEEDFLGGRGLEKDLLALFKEKRLKGIVNGIDPEFYDPEKMPYAYSVKNRDAGILESRRVLYNSFLSIVENMLKTQSLIEPSEVALREKFSVLTRSVFCERPLIALVSRLTGQKIRQFFESVSGKNLFAHLSSLPAHTVILGKGDLLRQVREETHSAKNIFLFGGFDDNLEKLLYAASDFMLMPSEFEPCGTSQMKAMRYGCLPIASAVGGLKDTIQPKYNGFLYSGNSVNAKATAFLKEIQEALSLLEKKPKAILTMQQNAMRTNFGWESPAREYLELMA